MTAQEFEKLSDEWLSIEMYANQVQITEEIKDRQIEIERLLDESDFEFDEDGKVIIREKP